MNSNIIYEGMNVEEDYLTGEIKITGKKESDKAIGYFSYFRLINGFEKVVYWTKERVIEHASKFSQGYQSMIKAQNGNDYKPEKYVWDVNFDDMALKTITKRILSKYGVLSTDMQEAMMADTDIEFQQEIESNANTLELVVEDIPAIEEPEEIKEVIDPQSGEILKAKGSPFTPEEQETMLNEVPF